MRAKTNGPYHPQVLSPKRPLSESRSCEASRNPFGNLDSTSFHTTDCSDSTRSVFGPISPPDRELTACHERRLTRDSQDLLAKLCAESGIPFGNLDAACENIEPYAEFPGPLKRTCQPTEINADSVSQSELNML